MLAQHCYNVSGFYDVGPMLFRCGVAGWDAQRLVPVFRHVTWFLLMYPVVAVTAVLKALQVRLAAVVLLRLLRRVECDVAARTAN